MIAKLIMFLCHLEYKQAKCPFLFHIKGTGKEFPRYLLYTEDEKAYNKLDNI